MCKNTLILISFTVVLVLNSCSQINLRPPKQQFFNALSENLPSDVDSFELNQAWALSILRATREQNCQEILKLESDELFPIKDFLLLKKLELCGDNQSIIESIWKRKIIPANWAKKFYYELSLGLARKFNLKDLQAEFSYHYSNYLPTQKQKVELLKSASHLTTNNELKENIKNRLLNVAPHLNPFITEENRYEIARDYENNRLYPQARSLYRKILSDENEDIEFRIKVWNRFSYTYKLQRDHVRYLKKTQNLARFLQKEYNEDERIKKHLVKTKIRLARIHWTQHNTQDAIKELNDIVSHEMASEENLALVYLIFSQIYKEKKNYVKTIEYLTKATTIKCQDEELVYKILWALAWTYYTDKNYEQSINFFNKIEENISEISYQTRAKFWKAIALEKMNKLEESKAIFSEIKITEPYGHYGILSVFKLNEKYTQLEERKISREINDLTLSWLIALKEYDYANSYLEYNKNAITKNSSIEEVLYLYKSMEDYKELLAQFYSIEKQQRLKLIDKWYHEIFPTPFKDEFIHLSENQRVEKELVYAITRQESAFNQYALSPAQAYGLMQLTPETAQIIADKYQIQYNNVEDLYRPEINLQMGVHLLRDLKDKFDNKFILYVASYNAASSVVKKWDQERNTGDPLEFIENIPYRETRNYVKLVLRNYINYKRIFAKESFNFPKDLF
ncbi:MAG: lytic transglycosylase domain-containing protein [Halobacteriovoraceae bacterium]|nr:lytic transglycosylase domain-containing protein [Halobacteriovoraceae bacterium]